MLQDLRFALRSFGKNPGFTALAALTVALGVGPNTAIFSMVDAVLLRPLPYRDTDRLVMLWETSKQRGLAQVPLSGPNLVDWRRESRSFEDMAPAFTIPEYGFNITAGGEPERAQAGQAAANLFSVIGTAPVLGRSFLPEEDRPGGEPVVLIGHAFWMRRFGGSPSVIGQSIGLDGTNRTVVGVLPRELEAIGKIDVWIPIAQNLESLRRDHHSYGVMARLKPGVTAAQAQTELDAIAARLEQQYPESNAGMGALVIPIQTLLTGAIRPALLVLLAAVGLLLLIACVNIANLLLARGAARQKEIAVRIALGATRARVVRQLLTESAMLAVLGGAIGVAMAAWSIQALRAQLPDLIPRIKTISVDVRVLGFSLALSVLTGILFGLVPAWRAVRGELNETLKEGGGKGLDTDTSHRMRTVLLAGQVALALVLLICSGLMMRSFLHVLTVDPGFRPDQVLTMQLTVPDKKYQEPGQLTEFTKAVVRNIETIPGVASAAAVNILPARSSLMALRTSVVAFEAEGAEPAPAGQEPLADYRTITPAFFQTMGIQLLHGRTFDTRDTTQSRRVVLINETMARKYFGTSDATGRQVRMSPFESNVAVIAGVVADIRMQGLERQIEPAIYVPFEQETPRRFSLVIRTNTDPAALAPAVRAEILKVDPDQAVADVRPMVDVVSDALLIRRLSVWLLGSFASLALGLASVGIYGLTAYSMSRRVREIGLRMALGASGQEVVRLLVWRGLAASIAGVALGLPAAFALAHLMRGLLFGVAAHDTATFVVVPLTLIAVAALASYLPARRATRIDPIVALRYE